MASSQSIGGVAIAVPVIVCMAGVMAAQSVEVRRGHTSPPREAEAAPAAIANKEKQVSRSNEFDGRRYPVSQHPGEVSSFSNEVMDDSMSSLPWRSAPTSMFGTSTSESQDGRGISPAHDQMRP